MPKAKEQIEANIDTDLEKLKAVVDAPETASGDLAKPEGKVVSISGNKLSPDQNKAIATELGKINKQVSELREEYSILKVAVRDISKKDENYLELKKIYDEMHDKLNELISTGRDLEKSLFSPAEFAELDDLRLKLARGNTKKTEEESAESKSLVLEPQTARIEHKDWGAWRPSIEKMIEEGGRSMLAGFIITYPVFGLPIDLGNWSYHKIKRLMGKGAELDGEKKTEEEKKFIDVDGNIIQSTGEQERMGLHIGDKLRLKKDWFLSDKALENAKFIEIFGFEKNGNAIIRVDGKGRAISLTINYIDLWFEPFSEESEEIPEKYSTSIKR